VNIAAAEGRLNQAKLGADAIYVVRDVITRSEGHRLVGIAVRYVR